MMNRIFQHILLCFLLVAGAAPLGNQLWGQGWYRIYGKNDPNLQATVSAGIGLGNGYKFFGNVLIDDQYFLIQIQADQDGQYLQYAVQQPDYYVSNKGKTVVTLPDGSYTILASRTIAMPLDSSLLLHYAPDGALLWQRALVSAGVNKLANVEWLNGGYLVSGVMQDSACFLRIGADGVVQWRLAYAYPGAKMSNLPLGEGENIAVSRVGQNAVAQGFVADTLPFQAGGEKEVLLNVNLSGYFETSLPPYWITNAADHPTRRFWIQPGGNRLALSDLFIDATDQKEKIRLRRINPSGVVVSDQLVTLYATQEPVTEVDLEPTADGGFIILGTVWDNNYNLTVPYIAKFDAQGIRQWEKPLAYHIYEPGMQDFNVYGINQASNGNYVIAGEAVFQTWKPFLIVTDSLGLVKAGNFAGAVRNDFNADCQAQPQETPLVGWNIRISNEATGQLGYTRTNDSGTFEAPADTLDAYRIRVAVPNQYWSACVSDTLVGVQAFNGTTVVNFPMRPEVNCAFMETDIGTPRLRRCFDNLYTVRYCNTGTVAAQGAYVEVTLDPAMDFVSAERPAQDLGGNKWRFELGQVAPGFCGNFRITAYLNCDNVPLGATHCVEAHIYPDTFCLYNNTSWSGANVEVSGHCNLDSVRFKIVNTGTAPTSTLDYVVVEDNIILYQIPYSLPANDSIIITVPADGSTWYLSSEQEPGSPYNPMPSATVSGCGGTSGFSFVSQFGEDDNDPFVSIDCKENIGSFDPNEKIAEPGGYGPKHYIRPADELEYQINFQNTGTDTAFTVVIRDTLSKWLDPLTFIAGASSHPYKVELGGSGFLKWTFQSILLPDSNTNEAASHGFVRYRIRSRDGAPLESVIENQAGIYFDFNAPVITNKTWHTLGEEFVMMVPTEEAATASNELAIVPNPAPAGVQRLAITGPSIARGVVEVFDATGRWSGGGRIQDNVAWLAQSKMPAGIYMARVQQENGKTWWAKWLIQ